MQRNLPLLWLKTFSMILSLLIHLFFHSLFISHFAFPLQYMHTQRATVTYAVVQSLIQSHINKVNVIDKLFIFTHFTKNTRINIF